MSLSVEHVSHWYKEPAARVLSDVSVALEDGDTLAIVGPSGSGKSTLLSVLGLLLEPQAGTVLIDGIPQEHSDRKAARARMKSFAWIFQSSNALLKRSVLDNAMLGLRLRGLSLDRAKVAAMSALDAVGLSSVARQRAATLSGGELQRVCLARSLAGHPRFVLADEPTGQLDRRNTEIVTAALLGARGRGTSVVIATHDRWVASQCDRCVSLVDGRLDSDKR